MMCKEYIFLPIIILARKGLSNNYLEELIKIKNKYIAILSEENKLLNMSINKDITAIDDLIDKLNDLTDTTIAYYYSLLDDIEKEIELNRNYHKTSSQKL